MGFYHNFHTCRHRSCTLIIILSAIPVDTMDEPEAVQHTLPLEIIHLILLHHGNFDRSRQKLRLVCKEWDKFILATSSMWADVVIDEHSSLDGTLAVLERSLTCPLNLTVLLPNDDSSHCAFIPRILDTEANRIASLHVKGRVDEHFVSALRWANQPPMPLLHTITLIMDDTLLPYDESAVFFEEDDFPNPYPTLLQCPSDEGRDVALVDEWGSRMYPALNCVTIVGVRLDWDRFPATNLTELRLVNQHVRIDGPLDNPIDYHIADVLRFLSPTLEVLELTDFWYDFNPSVNNHWDLIELLQLRSLTLGYSDPLISTGALAAFLEVLQVHDLTELTVTNRRVMSALQTIPREPSKIQGIINAAKSIDDDLLYQMISWGWIAKIEKLTLNCVVFSGDFRDMSPSSVLRYEFSDEEYEVDDPNVPTDDPKLPFTLGFIRALESLKHLSIWDPTGHFLYFANYPILYESTPPYALFNLSTLETLRIHSPNWFVASAFLQYRKRIQPELEVDVHPGTKRRVVTCACHSAFEFGPMASSSVEEEVDKMVDGWYEVVKGWPELTLREVVRRWQKLESEHLGSA